MTGKSITDNVEEYSKKIFDLIADNTVKGHERLIRVFEDARERYSNECRTKGRLGDFDSALQDLRDYDNHIVWLQTVSKFITKGEWNLNSASPILLFQLMKAAGYVFNTRKAESEASLLPVVMRAYKDNLCELVNAEVMAYKKAKEENDKKKQDLDVMREVKIRDLPNLLLFDNHELAVAAKLEHPEKDVFCLSYRAEEWSLNWYDVLGRANFLPVENDLRELLKKSKDNQLPLPTLKRYTQIKCCCDRVLKNSVFLFDDPELAREFVSQNPENHSFYLTRVPTAKESGTLKWQLNWFDLQGRRHTLPFNDKLLRNEEQLPPTDSKLHYQIKLACSTAVQEFLRQMRVIINPDPYGLSRKVGSYVLTHPSPYTKLEWVDSIGTSIEIDLASYPAFNSWLTKQESLDGEEVINQLKVFLMHLNTNIRREVDELKQNMVREVLQNGRLGMTLHAVNNMAKIPRYALTPGIYILMREAGGDWVLYQRQKQQEKAVNVVVDISTNEWEVFREILKKQGALMPDDLSMEVKTAICKAINEALKTIEQNIKNSLRCIAVNDFSLEESINFKARSFILTNENDGWALYYLNVFQKPIRVNLDDCAPVRDLLNDWTGKPELLTFAQLNELNKALADFTPVTSLNKAAFMAVEKHFANRYSQNSEAGKSPSANSGPGKFVQKSVQEGAITDNQKTYPSLASLLLRRLPAKKIEEEPVDNAVEESDALPEPPKIDKQRIANFASLFGAVVKPGNSGSEQPPEYTCS
jgi:chemotaxis protein CheY-P-specific phosphatase CheC